MKAELKVVLLVVWWVTKRVEKLDERKVAMKEAM